MACRALGSDPPVSSRWKPALILSRIITWTSASAPTRARRASPIDAGGPSSSASLPPGRWAEASTWPSRRCWRRTRRVARSTRVACTVAEASSPRALASSTRERPTKVAAATHPVCGSIAGSRIVPRFRSWVRSTMASSPPSSLVSTAIERSGVTAWTAQLPLISSRGPGSGSVSAVVAASRPAPPEQPATSSSPLIGTTSNRHQRTRIWCLPRQVVASMPSLPSLRPPAGKVSHEHDDRRAACPWASRSSTCRGSTLWP